jgi:hypothetical protein
MINRRTTAAAAATLCHSFRCSEKARERKGKRERKGTEIRGGGGEEEEWPPSVRTAKASRGSQVNRLLQSNFPTCKAKHEPTGAKNTRVG